MVKKIYVIADVHGRTNWKHKADIEQLVKLPNLALKYDKYIFLGDYVDSFTETNAVILHNLKKIIQFKKNYPNNVILLLGNHDLQYMFNYQNHGSSGYRPEAFQELHKLFNDNKTLFQPVYRINNYLFTHAGITTEWLKQISEKAAPKHKVDINRKMDVVINEMFDKYDERLFRVGRARGGYYLSGGPFWADRSETEEWVLPKYHQIIGHHPTIHAPYTHTLDKDSSITYCDNNKTGTLELIITT